MRAGAVGRDAHTLATHDSDLLRSAELTSTVDPLLTQMCVCPACRQALTWSSAQVACLGCGHRYPVVDGIPVFAVLHDDDHKRGQAEWSFDAVSEEWEIERPWGGAALYGWLMFEKFRRSLAGIEDRVPGAVTLVLCAGSGMDAEFLVRRGARVIASDLSLGAALRTRERARRHGVALTPLVADAEALPFKDRSVDLAYVHDGLHHLRDPAVGLWEMTRVTHNALSVSEPARAWVTRVAIRAGIALVEEPVGNKVARLESRRVMALLREAGMRVVGADRYAMFYRHEPGVAMRLMSRRRLRPIAQVAIAGFNSVLGGVSNKLAVRAVRDVHPAPVSSRDE
jgi:ubiquinone/menaquinone biosynthesis C-methylase UbiE